MKGSGAALILAIAGASCRNEPPPPASVPQKAPSPPVVELSQNGLKNAGIQSKQVTAGTFHPRLVLGGAITGDPKHVAQIGARVPGRVAAVHVALGDRVLRGQLLVEIDAAELHQTTLEYLTAAARLRTARDTLARQKQLVDERVGALQDLRRAEAEAAASEAALNEASEHLQFLGLTQEQVARISRGRTEGATKSQVRSPIDGQIAMLDVSLGQVLTGNESIVTVADVKEVWASLRVYERDLGSIHVGDNAEVRVPTYPERTFGGSVSFVSDVLEPKNRSADVRVSLGNTDGALRPGMSATGYVERMSGVAGVWLPVEAVQAHDGNSIVFVRKTERRFEARTVTAGPEQGGFRPITQGIAPNDDIVIHGAFALRAELERSALEE